MFGFSIVSNWKYALIIVLLLIIGLGKFYYEEQIEAKENKINELKVNVIRLQQAIDDQNKQIETWKRKNREAKEKIEEKQKNAKFIQNEMEKRVNELKNQLNENASCEESMNWMKQKANQELKNE